MPDGGVVSISASNLYLLIKIMCIESWGNAGPYIMITVADTGTGIAPEILDKIFHFFTTKRTRQRAGLVFQL